MVQPSFFTRYPLPGTPIRTASCRGVYRHSIYPTRKAYEEPEGSRRLCSLAIRRREGVSGPPSGPAVHLHSPSTAGKAYWRSASCPVVYLRSLSVAGKACSDLERSRRSSLLAIHRREGVSGPRAVQSFIFTRYRLPGRRIWSPNGPAVHLYSLSATRKAYPDPEWSIFTRHPPPGGRFRVANGPAVYRHSISATRNAYPKP